MKKLSKNVNRILGKAGFTLVELLVVMAILGILIAVAIGGIGIAQRGARDNTRLRDLNSVKGLIESYYGSYKKYPSTLNINSTGTALCTDNIVATSCTSTNGVSIQQGGLNTSISTSPTTTTCDAIQATNAAWQIGYKFTGAGQTAYNLCITKEDGSPVNLGSQ